MNHQNIIVVATEAPGLSGGAPVRNYNLIRQLVRSGRHVTLLCLSDMPLEKERRRLEQALGVAAVVLKRPRLNPILALTKTLLHALPPYYLEFRKSGIAKELARTASTIQPACILLEELKAYYAVEPALEQLNKKGVKIILDAHNVEWLGFDQTLGSFSLPKRLIGKYITPTLRRFEQRAAHSADSILTCSEIDKIYFKTINPAVNVIANGVDSAYFSELNQPTPTPHLLFMGGTQYPPNADAIRWYISDIHPLVKASVPNVILSILGGEAPAWLQHYAKIDPLIKLPGFVPDVRPYIASAQVCICPIRAGSGTRLKILEYMGAGKAIVSTSKGAEGIDYQDKLHMLIADGPEATAKAIVSLLNSKTYRDKLGSNAKLLAKREYDWSVIGDRLIQALPTAENTR